MPADWLDTLVKSRWQIYELYVKDADGHAESYLWTDPCSRNAGWERYRKIRGTMYIVLSVVTPWSTGVNVSSPINLGPVCLSAFILSAINVAHRGQRLEGSWRLLSTWQQVALQIVLHYRRALSVALAACLSADIPSHEITMIQSILGPIRRVG